MKIGSYIRTQTEFNAATANTTSRGRFDRTDTSQFSFRSRGTLSVDLSKQTEHGPLRFYIKGNAMLASTGVRPPGPYIIDDQDVYTVMFRVQRNFLP